MRIIAGEFRRRFLRTPADESVTRPIPDRVKESVFGLLRGHCEGANVLDAFAGTGAIGLEAVSRGAVHCVLVEQDKAMASILKYNIEQLGAQDRCELVVGDALGASVLARCRRPLTLAFFDPPYPLMEQPVGFRRVITQVCAAVRLLSEDGFAVLRTPCPLMWAREAPLTQPPRREHRKKGKDRFDWMVDENAGVGRSRRKPVEAVVQEVEVATHGAPNQPRITVEDLTVLDAVGPETHVYGGMAVHLYMRKR